MPQQAIADVDLVRFHARHIEIAKLTEHEERFIKRLEHAYARIELLGDRSLEAVTMIHDGRIIACCGLIMLCPGVCELWLIPTVYIRKEPVLFMKNMRWFIEQIASALKVHRMQTTSLADEFHDRFHEALGFECEGVLKQFTDLKEDYKQWARLF